MKKIEPSWRNPNWKYTPAKYTDILKRFKALGWIPSTQKN
jgi:hypothetical protein